MKARIARRWPWAACSWRRRRGPRTSAGTARSPTGRSLEIKGVNGDIEASLASGREAEVVAVKRARRSNPDSVEIKVVEHAGRRHDLRRLPPQRRPPQRVRRRRRRPHRAPTTTTSRCASRCACPHGVTFRGRTVNGGIKADGLAAPVDAETVNGDVRLAGRGLGPRPDRQRQHPRVPGPGRGHRAPGVRDRERQHRPGAAGRRGRRPPRRDRERRHRQRLPPRDPQHPPPPATPPAAKLGSGGRTLKLETVNGSIEVRDVILKTVVLPSVRRIYCSPSPSPPAKFCPPDKLCDPYHPAGERLS